MHRRERKQQEREAALEQYRQKRKKNAKMWAAKTPSGQPNMAYQMDMLLDKITDLVGYKPPNATRIVPYPKNKRKQKGSKKGSKKGNKY